MEGNIYFALNNVMQETGAITKEKKSQQGYVYRGVDQVLNQLQPLFAKHGIIVVPTVLENIRESRKTAKGGDVTYSVMKIKYTFYYKDGSFVESTVIGEAMDSGDKSSNKCMSVAFKYACFQVLCIPTEETTADPDDNNESLKAPEKEYKCVECQKDFEDYTTKEGKKYTGKQMYHISETKNGKALCLECAKKLKEEKENEDGK